MLYAVHRCINYWFSCFFPPLVLRFGPEGFSFWPDYGWTTILWRRLVKVEEEIPLTSWGRFTALLLLFCLYCSLTSWQSWNFFRRRKVCFFLAALYHLQLTGGDLDLLFYYTKLASLQLPYTCYLFWLCNSHDLSWNLLYLSWNLMKCTGLNIILLKLVDLTIFFHYSPPFFGCIPAWHANILCTCTIVVFPSWHMYMPIWFHIPLCIQLIKPIVCNYFWPGLQLLIR